MIIRKGRKIIARNVRVCTGLMKVMGLRFTTNFGPYDAYFFEGSDNIIDMFFVFHKIIILWLDEKGRVVHKRTARPFGVYAPPIKTRYVIEVPLKMGKSVSVGDVLSF